MRALVISGGGSKGAFAGGVAEYLMKELKHDYDLFLGTSTGSLLISHLALKKIDKIKRIYTAVNQKSIFSNCPFKVTQKHGVQTVNINHFNVLKNFIKGNKTFGDSSNLLKLIRETITEEEFRILKAGPIDVLVTVANISLNQVEYKSINDCSYEEFCDWVWISCNFVPFMSLAYRNGCEYADGGIGSMVPIEEAIKRGATEVDAIILETEMTHLNRMPSRNVFSLLTNIIEFMLDRIEVHNIRIGKYVAKHNNAIINLYYTPTVLTTNSLIFDEEKMKSWWKSGYDFAKFKNQDTNQIVLE